MSGAIFIDQKELDGLMSAIEGGKCILLDVRSAKEHAEGHIRHSMLMPLDEIESRHVELDRRHRIVVYCRSGPRSLRAAHILQAKGFGDVCVLEQGMSGWKGEVVGKEPTKSAWGRLWG